MSTFYSKSIQRFNLGFVHQKNYLDLYLLDHDKTKVLWWLNSLHLWSFSPLDASLVFSDWFLFWKSYLKELQIESLLLKIFKNENRVDCPYRITFHAWNHAIEACFKELYVMGLSSFRWCLKIDLKFKGEGVKALLLNDPCQSSLHDCVFLQFLFTLQ